MPCSVIFIKVKNTASFGDVETDKGQNTVMSPSNGKQVKSEIQKQVQKARQDSNTKTRKTQSKAHREHNELRKRGPMDFKTNGR